MKANELRICNNTLCKRNSNGWYEHTIDANDIKLLTVPEYQEAYKPIQITEEWLIKFGFNPDPDKDHYVKDGFHASFNADKPVWFGASGCCQFETIKEDIKYVHTLQNLYFALTGEELTIK